MGYEPSDEELLVAIPTSIDAFEAFYRRFVDRVVRFLAGRCRNSEDVADATTATFLAVLDSCATYRPDRGSGEAWLFTIARNEAQRLHRNQHRNEALIGRLRGRELLSSDDVDRIEEMIDAAKEAADLSPALDAIRPSERALLQRMVMSDMTATEASRSLGIEPAAGRIRLSRLRSSVRVQTRRAADQVSSNTLSPEEEQ